MKIHVTAKPKKKKARVEQVTPTLYIVSVHEPAEGGRANQAVRDALAEYFSVPRSQIMLINGQTGREKIFTVPDHLAAFVPALKQNPLF